MRARIFRFFLPIFASLLSGVLLVLAFPKFDLGWLAWVGLVPLLIAIFGRSPRYGFLLSLLCGVIFFAGYGNWLFQVPKYKFVHHVLIDLYLASYFGLFGLTFSFLSRRSGPTTGFLLAPFIWVSLEYIRSNLSFLALPWGSLGHSQYAYQKVIQIASVTGAYGVSFLIVMVNSAFAAMLLALVYKLRKTKSPFYAFISKRGVIAVVSTAAVLSTFTLFYGQMTLSKPIIGEGIEVSVVQGNIEQSKKWDRKYAKFIMETYADLSRKASEDRPELIVWPEAATPGFILKNMALRSQMMTLIRHTKTYYLIGSSEYPKFAKAPLNLKKSGNTALFFSPKGKVLGQHLKVRLVPFVEYIPYDGIIPWPRFIVPKKKMNSSIPGKEFTLFELDEAKFGVLVCWESLYPGLFRKFVKNGANFMLNISNEAWFGETAFPYQFLAINVFRAVENRISMGRATNTGISCFIDPFGRIISRLENNNKDIFIRGYLTQEIPLCQEKTFYTIYGDIFVYITLIITVLMIALSFLKVKKRL